MSINSRHLPVMDGLDILLGKPSTRGAALTASIRFRAWNPVESVLNEPCILKVWISPNQLRQVLGNTPLTEDLLARSDNDGDVHVPAVKSAVVWRVAEEIYQSRYTGDVLALFLQGKVLELLVEGVSIPTMSESERVANAVRGILLVDPQHPPTLAELAQMTGVSIRKVDEHFRSVFGTTIFKWLNNWRLDSARDLVLGSEQSISRISDSLGYAHLSNFAGAFSRRFGVSPRKLRSRGCPVEC